MLQHYKTVIVGGVIAACLSLLVGIQQAYAITESPRNDSLFYYKIGGGRHISIPPQLTITTLGLSASADFAALSCDGFDPIASYQNSLENLRRGVDNAVNAIETAASAAIVNLPGYILQKANPGLYDLFQNALLRAQQSYSLATKSCERMQHEISQNINPYAEWITLSRADGWKRSIGFGEKNIHQAAEDVKTAHNEGLTWIGGIKKGGRNQPPIQVLSEVGVAGLNLLSERPPESRSTLPSTAPLKVHFSDPDAVANWIIDVLGDVVIGTCDSCNKGAQPGKGLMPMIEQETDAIESLLIDLVTGITVSNRTNLEAIAAPGIVITAQVIRAIQNQSPAEIAIITAKLSQEIAEVRVMEKAMVIRRLLLAGAKEGNVSAISMAKEEIAHAVNELNNEIDNVIFEKDLRAKLVTDTVIEVLQKDNALRHTSVETPAMELKDSRPLFQGGVKP